MSGRYELAQLGERVAADGVQRHEKALQGLAATITPYSPGAAAVLRDPSAPEVLRQRAFAVAADVVLRNAIWSDETTEPAHAAQGNEELPQVLEDEQGQLAGWGA
jgi:hypothetical protein